MSSSKPLVLVIGGTGVQGIPVVKALTHDGAYDVRLITRNANSVHAKELGAIPGVTIVEGDIYSEKDLAKAFEGCTHAFINTNGGALGEKAEIYWGIRYYELARTHHLTHFLYSSLEYSLQLSSYSPLYRDGHMDAKAKVATFIAAQPTTPMRWSILTSCMYMEMLYEMLAPHPLPSDPSVLVFSAPLGSRGSAPLIALDDFGKYARWVFDTPDRSTGLNLHIASEEVVWEDLATIFSQVTGKKAVYRDVTLDEYFDMGIFPDPDAKFGHGVGDDGTLQSYRENFSGFWRFWASGVVKKDWQMMDEILPERIKSVGEWMKKVGYTGERQSLLHDYHGPKK
ncbi:hypothetical protein ACMFMG_003463 [Clarireedia jacksonii]